MVTAPISDPATSGKVRLACPGGHRGALAAGEQRHRPRQKQQTDRADRRGVENGHRRECQQGRSESGAPTWRHATAAAMTATTQATDPTRNSSPDAHPGEGRDRPVQVPHDHREDGSGQTDELQRAEVDDHPGVRLLTKTSKMSLASGAGWNRGGTARPRAQGRPGHTRGCLSGSGQSITGHGGRRIGAVTGRRKEWRVPGGIHQDPPVGRPGRTRTCNLRIRSRLMTVRAVAQSAVPAGQVG
jgi:hypothetical protein